MHWLQYVMVFVLVGVVSLSCTDNYATYDGGEITQKEVMNIAEKRLQSLEEQMQQIKASATEQVLMNELIEKETDGGSAQSYYSKFVQDKIAEIPEEQIKRFLAVNKISNDPSKQQIQKYRMRLARKKRSLYRDLLFLKLKKKYNAELKQINGESDSRQDVNVQGMPSMGPKDAPITLVSFTDFQCPYCQRAFYTIKELLSLYSTKVHYVYIDFPLGRHKMGKKAAHAVRCAGEQGSFWAYHDALFYKEKIASTKDFYHIASVLDLSPGKFRQCMKSGKYRERIKKSISYGQKLGVRGTPGFFINGRKLSGALPLTTFVRQFEQEGVSYNYLEKSAK